jgi:hypothetical protein
LTLGILALGHNAARRGKRKSRRAKAYLALGPETDLDIE